MLEKTILYSLDDVTIIPETVTDIRSRSECSPWISNLEQTNDNYYPIVAAPMASVISPENYKIFHDNKISCIIPRNISIENRLSLCSEVFCAFSMNEIVDNFINMRQKGDSFKVLIDIANGHMQSQIDLGKKLKGIYGNSMILMGGNIANPKTYEYYNSSGFDYIRVGIGNGKACTTSTQTGIHYPMASLISETFRIKRDICGETKIIADGGISNYSTGIKCLALGADYVMMGSVFGKSLEAAGPILRKNSYGEYYEAIPGSVSTLSKTEKYYREYYGMSTKQAQAEILGKSLSESREKLKTSEGKKMILEIEYTLSGWVDNFNSYLRSAMSYTNSRNLEEFKYSRCQIMSQTTSTSVNNK